MKKLKNGSRHPRFSEAADRGLTVVDQRRANSRVPKETAAERKRDVIYERNSCVRHSQTTNYAWRRKAQLQCHRVNLLDHVSSLPLAIMRIDHFRSIT